MRRLGRAFRIAMTAALLVNPATWRACPVRGDENVARTKGAPAKNAVAADAKPAPAKPKIAVFRLAGDVTELPPDQTFSFGAIGGTSLRELLERLQKAAADSSVKAVVLLHEGGTVGAAQAEELLGAMAKVRAAGKEIYAHADSLSMREYVLLSGASRLSVVPTADLWITGLFGESPYLRGLLDKLGVKPDFLTCGSYKSAAEIFLRDGPSPEAESMQNWLLDGIFEASVASIARGRRVEPSRVRRWIDGGPYTAEKARDAGMIDEVEHRQDFEKMLKSKYGQDVVFDKKYGREASPSLDLSSPFAMFKIWSDLLGQGRKKGPAKDAIGIVYVEGAISLGHGQGSLLAEAGASASKIRKALDEAARDPSIKAVVLRVNSPGGSAVASEIILDATRRVKARKPFVVSMGDVAGSGGYYVACASELIYADESTITASIGVVGGKLATSDLWKKVGVTFKTYKRGENAGLLSAGEPFSERERQRMQAWMNDVYEVFKGHVRAIRGTRLKKPLDELAGGRVFTGRQALELGLVDRIGGLGDAIAHVAAVAKLKDFDIRTVPAPKNFLEQLVEDASGAADDSPGIAVRKTSPIAGGPASLIDLAMPYLRHLDPIRVSAIRDALGHLELLQREGVLLMMPETAIPR
ncbi:MAG: signal peptide peptidase SppA [Isosphaeraceae bacterium]